MRVAAGVLGSDSPSQAGHAVHGHAATGVLTELGLQQVQPIFHNLAGRRCSIIKWPILQGWEQRNAVKSPGKTFRGCFLLRVMVSEVSAGRYNSARTGLTV